MSELLTIQVTTGVYGQSPARGGAPVRVALPTPTPTARDLIAAQVQAELPGQPAAEQRAAEQRAWAALAEQRSLLVIDGAPVTNLDAPLKLSGRSQISVVRMLPLLFGG